MLVHDVCRRCREVFQRDCTEGWRRLCIACWKELRDQPRAPAGRPAPRSTRRPTVTDARLWEISENLHRADLTPAERTFQLGEWVRLKEAQAAESAFSARGGQKIASDGSARGRPESGVSEAARELGVARETARRAAKAYDLPEPVKADRIA